MHRRPMGRLQVFCIFFYFTKKLALVAAIPLFLFQTSYQRDWRDCHIVSSLALESSNPFDTNVPSPQGRMFLFLSFKGHR